LINKIKFTMFLILFLVFIVSCSDDGSSRYFDSPVDVAVINVKCTEGVVDQNGNESGYVAFVADRDDGGRIKKIDGCRGKVDTDFDGDDGKTGLELEIDSSIYSLTDVLPIALDVLKVDGGYSIFTLVSAKKVFTDSEKFESGHFLIVKSINSGFEYAPDAAVKNSDSADTEKSDSDDLLLGNERNNYITSLGFYASSLEAFAGNIIVTGKDAKSGKAVINLFNERGDLVKEAIADEALNTPICVKEICYAISTDGKINTFNSELEVSPFQIEFFDNRDVKGISRLKDNKIAVWKRYLNKEGDMAFFEDRHMLYIISDGKVENRIKMPGIFNIKDVKSVTYGNEVEGENGTFDLLDESAFFEKAKIDEADFIGVNVGEVHEGDRGVNEYPDEDSLLIADDEQEAGEYKTGDADNKNDHIIWISTSFFGRIIAYNVDKKAWLTDSLETSSETENLGIKPNITINENSAEVSSLHVMRGLPFTVTYELSFEAVYSGSISENGKYDNGTGVFTDSVAMFENGVYEKTSEEGGDKLLIMEQSETACNGDFNIAQIVSDSSMKIEDGDKLGNCSAESVKYGIYPFDNFMVLRSDSHYNKFESKTSSLDSTKAVYSDDQIRVELTKGKKGERFRFTASPSISYAGVSNDVFYNIIVPMDSGNVLLFSKMEGSVTEVNPDKSDLSEEVEEYQ